jgi:hypothetical protein
VNILSSQPEIEENDKGLLIDFTIIGSRLNDAITRTKSLNIDFGTIADSESIINETYNLNLSDDIEVVYSENIFTEN